MSLSQDEDDHYAVSTSCVVGYVRQRVEVGLGVPLVGSAQQLDLPELLDNPPHYLLKTLRRHNLTTERIARGSTVDTHTRPTTTIHTHGTMRPYLPLLAEDVVVLSGYALPHRDNQADQSCGAISERTVRAD